MERTEQYWQRFRALPRVLQWAGCAVLVVLVVLLWDEAGQIREDFDRQAGRIERDVKTVGEAKTLAANFHTMADTIMSVGAVAIPASRADGGTALHEAVNRLLQNYPVKDDEFTHRRDRRLPQEVLLEVTGGAGRIETIRGDLSFESTVSDAIAIIAALEADPAVESIKSLKLTKSGKQKVKVRMGLEAWVYPSPEERSIR